jgi:hypothetical protein
MSSEPNERIFKLNTRVREIIRKRLPELEDFLVSVAIESYKEILKDEPEDPFLFLKNQNIGSGVNTLEQSDDLFYENENEEEEQVSVTTREFNGKIYYTFLEDEGNELCGVHERIVGDDNESEVGDLAGYVDDQDRFWEAHTIDGKIAKYTHKDLTVPAKTDTFMRYPDLDFLKKV